MTREEILAMEPGKELDKLVAIHVMGWSIYHYDKDVDERCYYMLVDGGLDPVADDKPWSWHNGERKTEEAAWEDNKPWSTDISAAWEVLNKMMEQYEVSLWSDKNRQWACEIALVVYDGCDTVQEAICKAAILTALDEADA